MTLYPMSQMLRRNPQALSGALGSLQPQIFKFQNHARTFPDIELLFGVEISLAPMFKLPWAQDYDITVV